MKGLICIEEENHGIIGYVEDASAVIDWLVKNAWLDSDTCIYDESREEWVSVQSFFGSDWKNELSARGLAELEEIFDGMFYFSYTIADDTNI
jgi:hypothetical protein